MTPAEILALRAVAEKATPGPWYLPTDSLYPQRFVYADGHPVALANRRSGGEVDATFIATFSPPTVLALLDRLERLEEVAGAARHDQYDPPHEPGVCAICDALARLEDCDALARLEEE